jgi:hypothetical protein
MWPVALLYMTRLIAGFAIARRMAGYGKDAETYVLSIGILGDAVLFLFDAQIAKLH